jgi:hypothetical protein
MRAARDSFLHFLSDNLAGLEVRNLRRDPDMPELEFIKPNAVNVKFLDVGLSVHVAPLTASIDIAHDSELSAIDLMKQVWSLLSATGYCAQKDYTDPQNPVALNSNLFWDTNSVSFRPISGDLFSRYNCTLTLSYHPL